MTLYESLVAASIKWVESSHKCVFVPEQSGGVAKGVRLTLNDFPEEPMHTLILPSGERYDFDELPSGWKVKFGISVAT